MRGAGSIRRRGAGRRPIVADHGTCRTGGCDQLLTRTARPAGRLSDIGRDGPQGERHLRGRLRDRTGRSGQSHWADRAHWADRPAGRLPPQHRPDPGPTDPWADRTHWPGGPSGASWANIAFRTRNARDARLSLDSVGSGGASRTQSPDLSLSPRRALRPLRTGGACRTNLTSRARWPDGALSSDRASRPGRALLSVVPLRTTREGDKTDETQSGDRNAHETSLAGAWHATFPAKQRKAKCGLTRVVAYSLRAEKPRERWRRRDPLKHGEGLHLYAVGRSRRTGAWTQDWRCAYEASGSPSSPSRV